MKEKKMLNNCDPRLQWVMDRILRYYQLKDETLAVEMLQRHNGRARKRLQCMFSGLDRSSKVFYAYQTTYPKTFYKEVTVKKEVPRPKQATPQTSDKDENSEESDDDDKKKKKEPKKKKKLKKKSLKGLTNTGEEGEKEDNTGDVHEVDEKPLNDEENPQPESELTDLAQPEPDEHSELDAQEESSPKKSKKVKRSGKPKKRPKSPASVVETLPTDQSQQPQQSSTMTIKMKRIIKKEKRLSQLHIRFNWIPWNNIRNDLTYVYFLRRNTCDIPIFHNCREANSEMPKYFYVGQLNEPLIETYLMHIQIYHIYTTYFLTDPFDEICTQTDGLEKFLKHRRKRKGSCPSTDAYLTADSFERRLNALHRALGAEGDVTPTLQIIHLSNQQESLEYLGRIVQFPSIVNMDPSDVTIQDRPDLIKLVIELKKAIPHSINKCSECSSTSKMQPMKNSILESIKELEDVMSRSVNRNRSSNHFDSSYLPELAHLSANKMKTLTSNEKYVQHLENIIQTFATYIENTMKKYKGVMPDGKGPLPLYDYWAVRHEQLSSIMEDCHQPIIDNILAVLRAAKSPFITDFKAARRSLYNYYNLCSDNVEYLQSTLNELKVLSRSKCLKEITRVVSNIVDGLRVMWVLSTFWGSEPHFVELLARIRWVICHKVTQILNVPKLFKLGNDMGRIICKDAIELMEVWKNSYSKTRSVIENTRCEQRWEFERDLLFQETEYISQVARSLLDIINVVKNYDGIFCRQFIDTVRNGAKIDSIVYKVNDLTMPLVTADFNVFDREYAENWKILLECFWSDMTILENEAVRVIRQSFTDLRSAVKSTELLNDLRNIISSHKLDRILLNQFEAVSVQFSNEIKGVMDVFIDDRENPPILRQHETYSGSVYWSRSLNCAIRDVLLVLQTVPEVLETRKFSEAVDDYSDFVDMISFYEKSMFVQMLHKYLAIVPEVFQKNIIKIIKKKVSREDDEYSEYWEWMARKKTAKRLTTMRISSNVDLSTEQRSKRSHRIPTRRTIEEDLRGISGSSSLSDSTCSSNVNSEYSSADESEVLSIVSGSLSLDDLSEFKVDEEVEEHNVDILTETTRPLGVKMTKRVLRKEKQNAIQVEGSEFGIGAYPLGEGVYKPITEILRISEGDVRKGRSLLVSEKQALSCYHEMYKQASSESTTPVTPDSGDTSNSDSNQIMITRERWKQTRTATNDKLSASGISSTKEMLDRHKLIGDSDGVISKRKYSNNHLKSLINLVRTKAAPMPNKPMKYIKSENTPMFPVQHSSPEQTNKLVETGSTSQINRIDEAVKSPHLMSARGFDDRKKKPIHHKNGTKTKWVTQSGSSNDSDQKSCDTDSSYSAQQLKRKMLLQSYSERLPVDSRESAFGESIGTDLSSTENELSDEGLDRVNKIEQNGEMCFPEGMTVGEVQPDIPSPEVTVLVARDIYNGVPRNIPGLTPKFVDGFLPQIQLSHPSTYSPIKLGAKIVPSQTSARRNEKSKTWLRRTEPITFWQQPESESYSSESSCTSTSLQSAKKYKFASYSTCQEQYNKSIRSKRENLTKLVEVEDWSDSGKKFRRRGRKVIQSAKNNEQNTVQSLGAHPAKSVSSIVQAAMKMASKEISSGKEQAKIYSGCRHDVKRFSWNEFMGSDILIEHGYSIQINYSETYESVIHEIELFEELGYDIPEDMKHISIMKNTLHSDMECVVKVVRKYTNIMESLKPTQVAALKCFIGNLEKTIYFGLTQYTWSSLNVSEYCSTVMGQLNNLQYLAFQLQYMEKSIETIVSKIVEIDCFQTPTNFVHSFQLFFKYCDYRRNEAMSTVRKYYRKITLILHKMECLLFSKTTGCSEHLLLYYIWAENILFDGLLRFVIRNLNKYEEFLLGTPKNHFCIEAGFDDKMVRLKPDLPLVTLELASQAEMIVGTLSSLVRWREGTCHNVPRIKSSKTGLVHHLSFVDDLIQSCEVRTTLDHIYETISVVTEAVDQYMERWKNYSHLWIFDEEKSMKMFLGEEPTLAEYDEYFSCYQTTIEEMKTTKQAANVHCVRIRVKALSQTILNIAMRWKSIMGDQLLTSSQQRAGDMAEKTEVLFKQLTQSIISLETFQSVLQAVNDCSSFEVEAELNLMEIYERHHLLRMWKVKIPDEDNQMAHNIEKTWQNLRQIATYRTHLLAPTMKLFVSKATEVCDLFSKTSLVFGKKYFIEGPGTYVNDLDKGLDALQGYEMEFANMEATRQKMVQAEKLFDLQPMNFDVFCDAYQTLKYELLVYDIYRRQREEKESWSKLPWNNFNPHKLLIGIDSYLREIDDLPDKCKSMPISISIQKHMENFKTSIPLMVDLQNKALRHRHWDELMEKTKYTFSMNPLHTKMNDLFYMKLHEHYSLIYEVIANAEREALIEAKLLVISEQWLDEELPIIQHYKSNGDDSVQYTLGPVDDIIALMDYTIQDLLVMSHSKFSRPFGELIDEWLLKLSDAFDVLRMWKIVQSDWADLENLHESNRKSTVLAENSALFKEVDSAYLEITRKSKSRPNVFIQCLQSGRKNELLNISKHLEHCKRNLSVYLDNIRSRNPRFNFLLDQEIMKVLGSSPGLTDLNIVTKMFVGLEELMVDDQSINDESGNSESTTKGSVEVTGMVSVEGEIFKFLNRIPATIVMEEFVEKILDEMRLSLKNLNYHAVLDLPNARHKRKEWASQHLGCTVLTSSQVWFCGAVEKAFSQIAEGNQKAMRKLFVKLNRELAEDVAVIRSELANNERKKLTTLLVQDAHSRELIDKFIAYNVMIAEEFEWTSQLRYYWSVDESTLHIKQCEGSYEYGFEYMGLITRQVMTPLTERVRLTVTQALTMKHGTHVFGPTATGKKETIKDLAAALGTMCIVVNCGPLLSYTNIAHILKTISSCGVWACFDKFDRIEPSTLSLISSSIVSLRQALLGHLEQFYCGNEFVGLNGSTNIFITTNPGYRGRYSLPESVNNLFRPVACITPDTEQICTITLISEGFIEARVLAGKMTCLHKLAKTQLTHSGHYDFGLRVIKSVLCIAGALKRNNPTVPEKILLVRALRDVFTPKLLEEDARFFHGLLADVFPVKNRLDEMNMELKNAIGNCMDEVGLIRSPNQTLKIIQLQTILKMRHSAILVGPTSGGKSIMADIFIKTLEKLHSRCAKTLILNPNICSISELYGQFSSEPRQWNDGILTYLLLEANKYSEHVYVLFDGSMHSEWVENLSTAMDDNRTLTLSNGDRIRLGNHCSLLFETGHLANCSPATVSRTGVVFVDPKDLGYKLYWTRWLRTRLDNHERDTFEKLFMQFVPHCLDLIDKGDLETEVPQSSLNMVTHLCLVIEAQLPIHEPPYISDVEEPKKSSPTLIEELTCVFIQALYLSIGAVLAENSRTPFDAKVKQLSGIQLKCEGCEAAVSCCYLPIGRPTLYEYKFVVENKQWIPWTSCVEPYIHDPFRKAIDIMVPNAELTKMLWTLTLICNHNCEDIEYQKFEFRERIRPKIKRPVLLIGESGSAKTSIVRLYLENLDRSAYERLIVHLTPRSGSIRLQSLIEKGLVRVARNRYAPPAKKKLLAFIDDLDMAKDSHDGPLKTYEFLKFIIERHTMYGRSGDKRIFQVNHVHFIGAMGKQHMEVKNIDPRFLSQFVSYKMSTVTSNTIINIFGAILKGHTENFSERIKSLIVPLIEATVHLYNVARTKFLPCPIKFHYIYNVRDLSHIFSSLLMTSQELYTDVCHFLRAWRNEFTRVICDRLMNEEDRSVMHKHIKEEISARFPECMKYVMRDPLLFGDFRNAMIQSEPRRYEDLLDYEAVFHLFTEITMAYNKENKRMDLILFEVALEHLTRIHRSLRQTRGHIVLIGAATSGKRSLTKLASYTARCHITSLTLRRYHSYEFFRETVSTLLAEIGTLDRSTTFLFASEHSIPTEFLEILNEVITNCSISTVLTDKEKEEVTATVRRTLMRDKIVDETAAFAHFKMSCLNNLHVVLSIAPVQKEFMKNCSLYPGIIRHSYVDWIFPWPEEALRAIATTLLKDTETLPEELKLGIIESAVHVHHSTISYMREYNTRKGIKCYLCPTHFLSFISDYLRMVETTRSGFSIKIKMLTRGLEKLAESTAQLDTLNRKLAERKNLIRQQESDMEQLSEKITSAEETLHEKSEESKEMTLQASTVRKMMYKQEAEIEDLMNKANPQLYSGRRALSELDQDSISSVCASAVVPEPVQVVFECVALLRGSPKLDWPTVKEYLEDPFILTKLRDLDPTAISDDIQQKIRTRLRSSRRISEMEQISAGGNGLLKYLEAILNFCNIYNDVKPMRKRAKDLDNQWHKLTSEVETSNEYIISLESEIRDMNSLFTKGTAEKSRMKDETSQMDFQLEAANALFGGLKEDVTRWTSEIRRLRYEADNIYGDCLLGAAFLNYVSVFDHELRQQTIYSDWKLFLASKFIDTTQNYTVEGQLLKDHLKNRIPRRPKIRSCRENVLYEDCPDNNELRWLAEGLPRDNHAVQNVILMKWSAKYPICIDPDQQMLQWIYSHESNNKIRRVSTSDSTYVENMTTALITGTSIVVCELEYQDKILEEIFLRNIKDDGNDHEIQIHGQSVQCHPNFRLYVVISSLHTFLDPSVFANALIVDCSMQKEAIEDKFIQVAMKCYHATLEDERSSLAYQRCKYMNSLESLNDKILQLIHTYEENMFDDFPYIQSLIEIKSKADLLRTQMNQEGSRIDEIDVLRSEYELLAQRSAVMFQAFNCTQNLSLLNSTSLQTFMHVVAKVFNQLKCGTPAEKLETLTRSLYDYQIKGLRSKDKLLYAFHLATTLEISEKRLTKKQMKYFLKNCEETMTCESPHTWITHQQWNDMVALTQAFPSTFTFLLEDLETNSIAWRKWLAETQDGTCLPTSCYSHVNSIFDQLLLIKILKLDALHGSIMHYVERVLGESFSTPSIVKFEDIVQFTTAVTPVLINFSPGTDPFSALMSLSDELNGTGHCIHVSMGSGSDEVVIAKMTDAMTKGQWLIVENCHLVPSLMFRLYNIFSNHEPKHGNFRLWLTVENVENFQIQFVLISHKVTIEAPSSLKLNLLDTYHSLDSDLFTSCNHPAFPTTVFSLAFFHAVIEERKNFGKYGWNMLYDFTKSDLLVSITIIKQYLENILYKENCKIPWSSLRYFLGEVVYGGRIVDKYDRRILNTYINEYFGDFILESNSPFKFNRGGSTCLYPLPPVGEMNEYIDYVNNLPLVTEPSVFGVHENRQRDRNIEVVRDLCRRLDRSSSNEENVGMRSLEEQRDKMLDAVATIMAKIPEHFQCAKQQASLGSNPKPTAMCLMRELNTFNDLIELMRCSLDDVRKAVTGLCVMTPSTNDLGRSLLNNLLPRMWIKFSPESNLTIGNWLSHFEKRHNQFAKWVSRGEPWILWLSGFMYPEAFMTAMSQVACRDEGWQIDNVALNTHVTDYEKRSEIPSKPKTGFYAEGLFLNGASWDGVNRCLAESSNESNLYQLPIVQLFPTPMTRLHTQGSINVPMYTTKRRKGTNDNKVIAELNIPTKKHQSYWILENVCVVMNDE